MRKRGGEEAFPSHRKPAASSAWSALLASGFVLAMASGITACGALWGLGEPPDLDAGTDVATPQEASLPSPEAGPYGCAAGDIVIQVDNALGGALGPYTVPIALDTRPYVASATLKADCSDLAAYATDGTPLPYWLSSAECDAPTTPVFVQIPSLAGGGVAHVCLRHGAPPPIPQDGASVFVFFDDFTGPALDEKKWTHWGSGTFVQAGGELVTQHANLLVSNQAVVTAATTVLGVRESADSRSGDDYEIGAGTVTSVSSSSPQDWLWIHERTGQFASLLSWSSLAAFVSGGAFYCLNEQAAPSPLFDGAWHDFGFTYDVRPGEVSFAWTRDQETGSFKTSDPCPPGTTLPVILGLDHATAGGSHPQQGGTDPQAYVDWVYVRALAGPGYDPVISVVASGAGRE